MDAMVTNPNPLPERPNATSPSLTVLGGAHLLTTQYTGASLAADPGRPGFGANGTWRKNGTGAAG